MRALHIFGHLLLLMLVKPYIDNTPNYVKCVNLLLNSSILDHNVTQPKEDANDLEIDESQAIHNVDDEIRNRDILHIPEEPSPIFNHRRSGCDILVDNYIEVATDPRDILRTQQLIGSLTPNELQLYFKAPGSSEKEIKKGKLFARFSLNAIVTPLETLSSSRDCFRMFYKTPVLFCCGDTSHRDFWMTAITKAKFCHFAHTTLSKAHLPAQGETAEKLPEHSTKNQRLESLLKDSKRNEDIDRPPPMNDNITNIDIKRLDTGKPDIFFNGEPVLPETAKDGVTVGSK